MNGSQKFFSWIWGLGLAILLYVLSIGPAVSFTLGSSLGDVVDIVWRPVIALDGTVAQPIYRGYLRLWGVHFPSPTVLPAATSLKEITPAGGGCCVPFATVTQWPTAAEFSRSASTFYR